MMNKDIAEDQSMVKLVLIMVTLTVTLISIAVTEKSANQSNRMENTAIQKRNVPAILCVLGKMESNTNVGHMAIIQTVHL